jgi:phosphohistidine phosphatase
MIGAPMLIYVLRHGIAEDTRPDADRALTPEGREKLKRVLGRSGASPGAILSSPLRRAVESAEVAAAALGYKGKILRTPALLPESSPYEAWEEVRSRPDEEAILLASHQPLVGALAGFLLGCPSLEVDMKKAALLCVECEKLAPQPRGMLRWLITPAVAGDR